MKLRTLKKGNKGKAVKQLQALLKIEDDGIFGPQTEQAVIEYQKANGLEADGIVGPLTWASLMGKQEAAEATEPKPAKKDIHVILGTAHLVTTPGKRSPDGKFREYAWSREIVTRVKAELEKQGVDVHVDYMDSEPTAYMRSTIAKVEQSRELIYRVGQVNKICDKYGAKNCVYCSIHVNAAGGSGWNTASGFAVYVSESASDESRKLAKSMCVYAIKNDLSGNRSIPSKKYWEANFYVIRKTACPAVLTENYFQDNKKDVAFLSSEEGKKAFTDLHVKCLLDYIG